MSNNGLFVTKPIREYQQEAEGKQLIRALGIPALIGGVLVSSPLQSFFLTMCLYPEWQTKAQEELDMVCGDRPPSFLASG